MMDFAKVIHGDVKGYKANGFDGLIEDGSQRSYFPNGFLFFVYAETLFDNTADFEEMKRDYFSHAYGEIWEDVVSYLTKITEAFDIRYLMGANFYAPKRVPALRRVHEITAEIEPILVAHKNMPKRAQTVAVRLLLKHLEYCRGMADIFILKALGADVEAKRAYDAFLDSFGRYEVEIERYFDHHLFYTTYRPLLKEVAVLDQ